MRKTFAAIQRHVDASAAYVPLRPNGATAWEEVPAVTPENWSGDAIDEAVRNADPAVVVANSRFGQVDVSFVHEYPLVHVRHGSSVGRDEVSNTTRDLDGIVDVALAPGERWARRYRGGFTEDVRTPVVGIPEADDLVETDPPGERRVLYAPTNHNYGGGSYLETATDVLDTLAESATNRLPYELRFRPHPHDCNEEPGRSLTERCKERIADLPNVTFDDAATPRPSMLGADLLVSDYSGIVTEWLHTGRPLVQLTDLDADRSPPRLGVQTDRLTLDLLDRLFEDGYPAEVERSVAARTAELAIPMDGRAGERAAKEVMACTQ